MVDYGDDRVGEFEWQLIMLLRYWRREGKWMPFLLISDHFGSSREITFVMESVLFSTAHWVKRKSEARWPLLSFSGIIRLLIRRYFTQKLTLVVIDSLSILSYF